MRLFLNVSAVLVCGALAGLSALTQSVPSHAASVPLTPMVEVLGQMDNGETLIRHSGGIEAHFDAANTAHDGHLTKAQAEKADWSRVAKHFDEIDTDRKGWVSVDQIHAFNKSHRKHRKEQTA